MMKLAKDWHDLLKEEVAKPYIQDLKNFLVGEERAGKVIFPQASDVFNAFSHTPYAGVKVVIMGQDPYHNVGQAHGLCFSVRKGVDTPPSLKNIYKEMEGDLGLKPPGHGSLEKWTREGVLLLNATLTVEAHKAKSHYGKGWERFTDTVVEKLCERRDPMVFILWGRSARDKCENILNKRKHPHKVICSAHPSPLSAYNGFFGSKPFSRANEILINWGKKPVDWSL